MSESVIPRSVSRNPSVTPQRSVSRSPSLNNGHLQAVWKAEVQGAEALVGASAEVLAGRAPLEASAEAHGAGILFKCQQKPAQSLVSMNSGTSM